MPKFGEVAEQGVNDGGPDPWHGEQDGTLVAPGLLGLDVVVEGPVEFVDLAFEVADMTLDVWPQCFGHDMSAIFLHGWPG